MRRRRDRSRCPSCAVRHCSSKGRRLLLHRRRRGQESRSRMPQWVPTKREPSPRKKGRRTRAARRGRVLSRRRGACDRSLRAIRLPRHTERAACPSPLPRSHRRCSPRSARAEGRLNISLCDLFPLPLPLPTFSLSRRNPPFRASSRVSGGGIWSRSFQRAVLQNHCGFHATPSCSSRISSLHSSQCSSSGARASC